MLQALNTGHDGSMSTIHANGAADALVAARDARAARRRGAARSCAVRAQVVASVDAVVFVARRPGGMRRVEAIGEVVDGDERVRPLFAWDVGSSCGRWARRGDRHAGPTPRRVDPSWFRC